MSREVLNLESVELLGNHAEDDAFVWNVSSACVQVSFAAESIYIHIISSSRI